MSVDIKQPPKISKSTYALIKEHLLQNAPPPRSLERYGNGEIVFTTTDNSKVCRLETSPQVARSNYFAFKEKIMDKIYEQRKERWSAYEARKLVYEQEIYEEDELIDLEDDLELSDDSEAETIGGDDDNEDEKDENTEKIAVDAVDETNAEAQNVGEPKINENSCLKMTNDALQENINTPHGAGVPETIPETDEVESAENVDNDKAIEVDVTSDDDDDEMVINRKRRPKVVDDDADEAETIENIPPECEDMETESLPDNPITQKSDIESGLSTEDDELSMDDVISAISGCEEKLKKTTLQTIPEQEEEYDGESEENDNDEDDAASELSDEGDDADNEEDLDENKENEPIEEEEDVQPADFFFNEAEVSGSESSDDEDPDDDVAELIDDEGAEKVDSEKVRKDIQKVYQKELLNEDKRMLLQLQERYLEDGDLHSDQKRVKKFRWGTASSAWLDNARDSDSSTDMDDDDDDDDDDENVPVFRLKNTTALPLKSTENIIQDSTQKPEPIKTSSITHSLNKPSSSITSYLVRDKQLNTILSTKRSNPFDKYRMEIKKLKPGTSQSKSLFELFKP